MNDALRRDPSADLEPLLADLDAKVAKFNEVYHTAFGMIVDGRITNTDLLTRFYSQGTLGAVGLWRLDIPLPQAGINKLGDRLHAEGDRLDRWVTAIENVDRAATVLSLASGGGTLVVLFAKQGAKKGAIQLLKLGAGVAGGAVAGDLIHNTLQAAGVDSTTKNIVLLASDIAQLILLRRKLKATTPDTPMVSTTDAPVKTAGERATEIHQTLKTGTQGRTTTAVTETAEGVRVVSSSELRLRPAQRRALQPGEVEGVGPGHAELTGVNAARSQGLTPTGTAASRPICPNCADTLQEQGVQALSPLKKRK